MADSRLIGTYRFERPSLGDIYPDPDRIRPWECFECSAFVLDPDIHAGWHRDMESS